MVKGGMVKSRHITPRRPKIELGDALLEVIRVRGALIFSENLRSQAKAVGQTPFQAARFSKLAWSQVGNWYEQLKELGVREAASRSVAHVQEQANAGIKFLGTVPGKVRTNVAEVVDTYQQLPTLEERTEFLLTWVLYVASFLGGMAMGLQAPRFDLAVKGKGAKDSIVLHSFPLLAVNVSTQWLHQVLEETENIPGLTSSDLRRLKSLRGIVSNLSGGVRTGAATREWRRHLPLKGKPHTQRDVLVDAQAYRLAEALVLSLQDQKGRS